MEHLFTKFCRGEEARGGKGDHYRLGLYIVRRLTEKLGSTVKAYNAESGEACISFDFSSHERVQTLTGAIRCDGAATAFGTRDQWQPNGRNG